jgi:hypothetical protein
MHACQLSRVLVETTQCRDDSPRGP